MSHKFHNSLNSSNTELQSDEISQYTPVKHNLNNNNYSSTLQNSPKSASSINKYRYNMQKKDRQTAELMFSAKISSDKDREILYSSTMKQMSPNSFNNYGNQKIYNYYPSQETDTSSIKGFESHVIRMRTPPKKKINSITIITSYNPFSMSPIDTI